MVSVDAIRISECCITTDPLVARLIGAAQQLVALNRPSRSEYNSVENYFHNTQPLRKEEQSWIQCKEDLVTLRPGREHAWLDTGIEHLLRWTHCRLIEVTTDRNPENLHCLTSLSFSFVLQRPEGRPAYQQKVTTTTMRTAQLPQYTTPGLA